MKDTCFLLLVKAKDETSFGKYICHIRDGLQTTVHTILVEKETSLTVKEEENNFVGIIVVAILVAILIAIVVHLICKIYRLKSLLVNKSRQSNDLKHVYEILVTNDQNYEQVENEQSTYTALKKPGERDDDHVYSHLNEVDKDYANQKKNRNLNNFVFINIVRSS